MKRHNKVFIRVNTEVHLRPRPVISFWFSMKTEYTSTGLTMSWYNNAFSSLLSFLAASVNRESPCRMSGLSKLISLLLTHGVLILRFCGCTLLVERWFSSLSLKQRPLCTCNNDPLLFSLTWVADGLGCMISNNLMLNCFSISWKTSDQLWKSSNWIVILMTTIITLQTILSNALINILFDYKKTTWLLNQRCVKSFRVSKPLWNLPLSKEVCSEIKFASN